MVPLFFSLHKKKGGLVVSMSFEKDKIEMRGGATADDVWIDNSSQFSFLMLKT